jgi:hypothetical protein
MLFTDKMISLAIRMAWVNNTNYFYYDYINNYFYHALCTLFDKCASEQVAGQDDLIAPNSRCPRFSTALLVP